MAKVALVVGIVWFVGMTPGTDQNRPDFGGKWTLVRDAGAPADPGIFGETFVATQYSTSLIIDWSFLAQARGVPGKVERAAHSSIHLRRYRVECFRHLFGEFACADRRRVGLGWSEASDHHNLARQYASSRDSEADHLARRGWHVDR